MSNLGTATSGDDLIDVSGAAQMLGRSLWWVISHTSGKQKPRLPFIRFGRKIQFRRSDLLKFIDDHAKAE